MLRLADRLDATRRRHEPGPLPGARGRVPGRRPRVHAADRADRREPRQPRERRGVAEARAPRCAPLFAERPDLADTTLRSPSGARSTWGCAGSTSRTSRRRRAEAPIALLAERCWRGVRERGLKPDRESARPPGPRARDDPQARLRGVLPHRRRHRRPTSGRWASGRACRGSAAGLARLLPHRHLRRRRAPPRPGVRALPEPAAPRSCPTSTSTSSRPAARTSTT